MLSLVLFLIRLLAVLNLPTTAGVVYYVKPTEPCAHNSSCPSNETCHTMDHYASNSSYYFSPDLINVTLYFMCGVHNCTQHMDISDLERFIMISTLGRNHVTIYMPIPIQVPNDPQNSGNRTYRFANVSILRIENVTVFFISLNFIGKQNCQFEVEHVNFYGYIGSMSAMVSVINVTNSQAMLKDSIFQHNCFIRIQSSTVLQISDCTFSLYNHAVRSAIVIENSTIKLTGSVSFINNTVGNNHYSSVCGGAISFNIGHLFCENFPTSIFSIIEARVNFYNNTAMNCGGAIYLKCTLMTVYNKVNMTFASNTISNFHKYIGGGAMHLEQSNFIVKNAILQFVNNSAKRAAHGGAISQLQSSIIINDYGTIIFINNTSLTRGGAIFHSAGNSISVDRYSSLLFYNNSAGQGGALYMQLSGNIRVGSDSYIEFSSNTATKYAGPFMLMIRHAYLPSTTILVKCCSKRI